MGSVQSKRIDELYKYMPGFEQPTFGIADTELSKIASSEKWNVFFYIAQTRKTFCAPAFVAG